MLENARGREEHCVLFFDGRWRVEPGRERNVYLL